MKHVLKFELDRPAFDPIIEEPYFAFHRSAYTAEHDLEQHNIYMRTPTDFIPLSIEVTWHSEPGTVHNHHNGRADNFTHSWPVYMASSPLVNNGQPFDIYPLTLRNMIYVEIDFDRTT